MKIISLATSRRPPPPRRDEDEDKVEDVEASNRVFTIFPRKYFWRQRSTMTTTHHHYHHSSPFSFFKCFLFVVFSTFLDRDRVQNVTLVVAFFIVIGGVVVVVGGGTVD